MMGSTNKVSAVRGLSTLVRPRFGPGMLLQHDDLDLLTDYTRELNRLMFRSLFGCGVVCGLEVKTDKKCEQPAITVDPGVGIVCSGDPVYVPRQQSLVLDKDCAGIDDLKLWVVLCGIAKACSPRPSMCASDDDELVSSATREREGFEIKVVVKERPKCACGCDPDAKPKPPAGGGTAADGTQSGGKDSGTKADSCGCVKPDDPCYKDHYSGVCGCECEGGDGCCDCIVLALLSRAKVEDPWTIDHRVRRFIRPVLMRDPLGAPKETTGESGKSGGTGAKRGRSDRP